MDTTLLLQDVNAPERIRWDKGSTILFVENHGVTNTANITLAGLFGLDVQVILPRAVYRTSIDVQNPGVNYFAFVDYNGIAYNVIASDNISLGGTAAHTIQPDPAVWTSGMNVMDGALAVDAFSGPRDQWRRCRYHPLLQQQLCGRRPGSSTITIEDTLTINDGAILQTRMPATT